MRTIALLAAITIISCTYILCAAMVEIRAMAISPMGGIQIFSLDSPEVMTIPEQADPFQPGGRCAE